MHFRRILRQNWLAILVFILFFFWAGFFITEYLYNVNTTTYTIEFNLAKDIDVNDVNATFFLDGLRKYKKDENGNFVLDENGEKIEDGFSYASVNSQEIFDNEDIEVVVNNKLLKITVKAKYFIRSDGTTVSSESLERFNKVLNKVVKYHDKEAVMITDTIVNDYCSGLLIGGLSCILGFVVLVLAYALYYKKHPNIEERIYDNDNLFRTPFHKKYWRYAINSVKKIKVFDMCLIAVLFALQLCLKLVSLPSGFSNLGIGLTYLVFATIAMIYGPIWGLIIGFLSDVIGFYIVPSGGVFHLGFTLQAMLSGFLYSICLYKTDLRFSKVLLCRLVINILINGIYGAILMSTILGFDFNGTLTYILSVALPKNIIYLFPQSILLYYFLKGLCPVLKRRNIIYNDEKLKYDDEPIKE